ncbi:MAG TPA: EamA family transporter [Planctomycetota bacterium]|jgi:drug/metabolite transporter (DMT)-like permease
MTARTTLALCATILFWASAFPAIRQALHGYQAGQLALLRFMVASICLILFALIKRFRLPPLRDIPLLLVCGFLGVAVYHTALNFGTRTVEAGPTCFVINTAPAFTAILARIVLGERLRLWGWAGMLIAFSGVAMIAVAKGGAIADWGIGLLLLAAVSWSTYMIIQKPLLRRYTATELTAYSIWAGTLWLMIFAPDLPRQLSLAPWQATVGVVYLGIFPAALAYFTWSYALSHMPVSRAASFMYIVPVFATFLAWLWLGEQPPLLTVFGGAVVLSGVAIVNTLGRTPLSAAVPSSTQSVPAK